MDPKWKSARETVIIHLVGWPWLSPGVSEVGSSLPALGFSTSCITIPAPGQTGRRRTPLPSILQHLLHLPTLIFLLLKPLPQFISSSRKFQGKRNEDFLQINSLLKNRLLWRAVSAETAACCIVWGSFIPHCNQCCSIKGNEGTWGCACRGAAPRLGDVQHCCSLGARTSEDGCVIPN